MMQKQKQLFRNRQEEPQKKQRMKFRLAKKSGNKKKHLVICIDII